MQFHFTQCEEENYNKRCCFVYQQLSNVMAWRCIFWAAYRTS